MWALFHDLYIARFSCAIASCDHMHVSVKTAKLTYNITALLTNKPKMPQSPSTGLAMPQTTEDITNWQVTRERICI